MSTGRIWIQDLRTATRETGFLRIKRRAGCPFHKNCRKIDCQIRCTAAYSRTNLLFFAEAGFMRASVLILCRYQLCTARCDRSDGTASPQWPSDGRSPAARPAFLAGEERAPRSQKWYYLLKYIFICPQPEAILFGPTSWGWKNLTLFNKLQRLAIIVYRCWLGNFF